MFCPNCGKENQADQKFCRSCGLKLDAVLQVVADQFPSEEYAAMQRRKRIFERLGLGALSIAGLIGLMLIYSGALQADRARTRGIIWIVDSCCCLLSAAVGGFNRLSKALYAV